MSDETMTMEWPVRIMAGVVDVTERVVALLDLVAGSLDQGSGSWRQEDVEAVAVIAGLLGLGGEAADARGLERGLETRSNADLRRQLSWLVLNPRPDREFMAAMHEEVSRRGNEVLAAGLTVGDEASQRVVDELAAAARARLAAVVDA